MAQIKIYGTPKKMEKRDIKKAASFFCDHLMKRLSKNITIVIKFKRDMFKETRCFGFATWTDEDVKNNNHRKFEIEIEANLGPVFLIRTLAHELVHVKQYARKELIECSGNYQKWNKTLYNENIVGYKNLPWEQEAISREKELYELWKQHLERQGEKGEKVGCRKTT